MGRPCRYRAGRLPETWSSMFSHRGERIHGMQWTQIFYVFQSQSCRRYEHLIGCTVIRTRSIQAVLLWIIQLRLTKLHFLFIWRPNFVWNFSSYTKYQDTLHIFCCSFKCHIISISDLRKVGLLTYITQRSNFIKYTRYNDVVLFRTNAVEKVVIVAEH